MSPRYLFPGLLLLALPLLPASRARPEAIPPDSAIDAKVRQLLARTHANGMAIGVVRAGKVAYVQAYGIRNPKGEPLRPDTVMYGASLTKAVFAYTVMRLVDRRVLALDTPLAEYLDKPLPEYPRDSKFPDKYGPYQDLASDDRWQQITARMCLTHSTGFANFAFLEPDKKLRIHFQPGSRYAYSGEGLILLQFVVEHGARARGLGLDVGDLTQAIFNGLGMQRTSLMWRNDFSNNVADAWNDHGDPQPHDQRSKVRVAGSMDTTVADFTKFAAALVRGDGLSVNARTEMTRPQLQIRTAHQFPTLQQDLPVQNQRNDLSAGLGLVVFDGPQGHGYYKGGHDEQTANTMVCLETSRNCVVILANDVRAEAGFTDLVKFILGDTGAPFDWEYGDRAGKS